MFLTAVEYACIAIVTLALCCTHAHSECDHGVLASTTVSQQLAPPPIISHHHHHQPHRHHQGDNVPPRALNISSFMSAIAHYGLATTYCSWPDVGDPGYSTANLGNLGEVSRDGVAFHHFC
jgi:hypothetical protein